MRNTILLLLFLFTSVCSEVSPNLPESHFNFLVKKNNLPFSEYLVLQFDTCHLCRALVIKLIKDGYLSLNKDKAIVLIINDRSELQPVQRHLSKPNLLTYAKKKSNKPIIDNLPRIYTRSHKGIFEYEALSIEAFNERVGDMSKQLIGKMMEQGIIDYYGSISKLILGIPIPGNENFISQYKEGKVNYDILTERKIMDGLKKIK